jgi:solute carrier family 25 oxoglutarate transporter 11
MSKIKNMLIAGTSGFSSILTFYPIETLKTRIQMGSEAGTGVSPISVMKEMYANEGVKSFYMGLGAALMRQFLFASFRIGIFYNMLDHIKQRSQTNSASLLQTIGASLSAGGFAILTVMPFDVVFVRMQAENSLPLEQRRGYTSMFNGLSRVAKEEGVRTLWKGVLPAVARAMALNFGMLVPYEKCKSFFTPYLGQGKKNNIASSAVAGLSAAICALPFDNAKVKLQKQTSRPNGELQYKGLMDCMKKTLLKEGIKGYWAGFGTFYSFVFPQSVMLLLVNEFLRSKFNMM